MLRAIRSEFLKYFTTRLWWGMAIAIVASAVLFTVFFAFVFVELMPETTPDTMPPMEPVQLANSGSASVEVTLGTTAVPVDPRPLPRAGDHAHRKRQ